VNVKRARTALALLVTVTGCGSATTTNSATTTPTTAPTVRAADPTLTHAEFVKRLDVTCRGGLDDLGREAVAAGDDTEKLAAVVRSVAGRINAVRRRQAQLTAPAEDQQAFRRYLNAQRRMAAIYTRMGAALDAGDVSQTRYFLSLIDGLRAARTTAALDLDLKRCGA
jgi:hypothetical protein